MKTFVVDVHWSSGSVAKLEKNPKEKHFLILQHDSMLKWLSGGSLNIYEPINYYIVEWGEPRKEHVNVVWDDHKSIKR